MNAVTEEIKQLKKEKNAVILAHYYVEDAVQEIADYIGDSYYLSRLATETTADVVVFCGVGFMGEDVYKRQIYTFGASSDEVIAHYKNADYCAKDLYEKDEMIKKCVDFIVSDELKQYGDEENLARLHHEIISKDWFMTLLDFKEYIKVKEQALAD